MKGMALSFCMGKKSISTTARQKHPLIKRDVGFYFQIEGCKYKWKYCDYF